MIKAEIKFIKKVERNGSDLIIQSGEMYRGNIHYLGVTGGFDRHGDNTMEGAINPIVIFEITGNDIMAQESAIGTVLTLELHYEINLKIIQ